MVSSLFGFWFLVGLGALPGLAANNGSPRSIISSTFELDTGTGWESIPLRSSLSRVSLSLDAVVGGEVDELEEDVGWLLSCLEGVIVVEGWELEEELVDKPGTTIGTKFSVLHCIRIFLRGVVFDRWSTRKNIHFYRKAFRAIILAGVFSKTFIVKIFPVLWRTQLPLHASALLHWQLLLSSDFFNLWQSGPAFFWWISRSYNSNTVLSFLDSRILSLYSPSKISSDGIFVIDNKIPSHSNRIPEYHHFEEQ